MPLFAMTVEVFIDAPSFELAERAISKDLEGRPHSYTAKKRVSENPRLNAGVQ